MWPHAICREGCEARRGFEGEQGDAGAEKGKYKTYESQDMALGDKYRQEE